MKNSNTQRTLLSPSLIGLCLLSLLLALAGMPLTPAYAATSAEKFAEADAVMQRIDALQTDLNQANEEYETAVSEHEAATEAMNDAQERIEAAEDRIEELQERLGDRAASMYKNGNTSFFDVLLDASSFDEFLTSWDMIERISSQDAELVEETKTVRAEAEDAREEYATQKARAADEMLKAQELKEQIEATQQSLTQEAESLTAEARELQAQEELLAEQARQAAAAAAAAAEAMAAQASGSSPSPSAPVSGNGQFTHPCPSGTISSYFGWRDFDSSFHQGMDFAASSGTPYYAAAGGTVILAGENGTAGLEVIIAHGDGLVTKYMHSSELYVSVGQTVAQGETLGAVGSTGNSTGPHLHFQVDVNGTAVDPRYYL